MNGGMFAKLINPDTGKQHVTPAPPATSLAPITPPPAATKKRKQISAYLSPDQLRLLKEMHFQFNSGDTTVEKSEIIGLSVEILAELLRTQVLSYTSIQHLRQEFHTKIAKYLSTQGANHSGT